jgi:flagellar biosynthesis anti-sigma factor FlgM
MRIELKTPDVENLQTERQENAPAARSNPEASPTADTTKVSLQDSATVGALTAQSLQMPEVRQEKVDGIRQSLANGQYRLDAKASAAGMRRRV